MRFLFAISGFIFVIGRRWLKSALLCSFLIMSLCSFEPQDLIYKNINLLPDTNDQTNRVPDFIPKGIKEAKPEKLYDKPKMPDMKVEEKVMTIDFSVAGFLKEHIFTTQGELEKSLTPTAKGVDNMFHLSDFGIKIPQSASGGWSSSLADETRKLPFINPSGIKVYKGGSWIVTDIKDFQAIGIDDVLPKSVGAPNTAKDRDPQAIFDGFLPKGMTPDDMLKTKIIDILP